jgi:NTE family protein
MSKMGLVFAGGGGKGAYQIGAWKALKAFDIDKNISAISGTSIGALNAMLFLQGKYNEAEDIWINISQEKMLPIDEKLILRNILYIKKSKSNLKNILDMEEKLKEYGTVSRDGLNELIDKYLDYETISLIDKECYICCAEVPDIRAEYFNIEKFDSSSLKTLLYATSAIPLVFDRECIDGRYYMDGGLIDNVPVKPLYDAGCDIIIVIYFNKRKRIDKSLYPNSKIIEMLPSRDLGGWLRGTLNFSKHDSIDRILEGYKDGVTIFSEVFMHYNKFQDMGEFIHENYDNIHQDLEGLLLQKQTVEDELRKLKQIMNVNSSFREIRKLKRLQN